MSGISPSAPQSPQPRPRTDSLRDLAHSTRAFFERFGVQPQISDTVRNLREETDELIEAAQGGSSPEHIAEEAADVFVTAIGVCLASGIEIDTIIEQVYAVVAKNDAKTHSTHIYRDGKIRRR